MGTFSRWVQTPQKESDSMLKGPITDDIIGGSQLLGRHMLKIEIAEIIS